jgi:hypothetical protein
MSSFDWPSLSKTDPFGDPELQDMGDRPPPIRALCYFFKVGMARPDITVLAVPKSARMSSNLSFKSMFAGFRSL